MENTTNPKSPLSGFFRRGIATVIDFILLLIVFLVLGLSFSLSINWNFSGTLVTQINYLNPLNALLFFAVMVVYFTITESIWGSTLGKLILREKVVSLRQNKLSFTQALLRNILKPIDFIVGPVLFLLSKKNQTLGDRIAGTTVIRRKFQDMPISDRTTTVVRKVFAGLFAVLMVAMIVLTIWTIPKVSALNEVATSSLVDAKNKISSNDMQGLYQTFSPEFQKEVTLEDFEKSSSDPTFRGLLNKLNPNDVKFYTWQFDKDEAVMVGRDGDVSLRLHFLKDGAGVWRVVSLNLRGTEL